MQLSREKRSSGWWLAGPLAIGGFVLLFFFEPTHFPFYPRCYLHQWTGISCPGCGGLRAAHQLLHGHVMAAFRFNPLFILLLPLFGWMVVRELVRRYNGKVYPSPFRNAVFGWTMAAVVILFGVARNLPFPVFAWMNP